MSIFSGRLPNTKNVSPAVFEGTFHPNQLVWASYKVGRNKKSFWPAVILNEEEWTNVPTYLKSSSSEEKLIWKLRRNAKLAMSKVVICLNFFR